MEKKAWQVDAGREYKLTSTWEAGRVVIGFQEELFLGCVWSVRYFLDFSIEAV